MRNRLMGMIALWTDDKVGHTRQLEQRPPTFEAYQIFEGAVERFRNQEYAEAMTEYRRAFLADTEFVGALLSAGIASWNLGDAKTDSIVREIHLREAKLGDYQRLRLESLDALVAGDGEAEVIALRKASAEAPASMATYNLAVASPGHRPSRGSSPGSGEPGSGAGRHAGLVIVPGLSSLMPCISSEITNAS